MLFVLLSVMVNWHITHLVPEQTTFHTKCILSELGNVLNSCEGVFVGV